MERNLDALFERANRNDAAISPIIGDEDVKLIIGEQEIMVVMKRGHPEVYNLVRRVERLWHQNSVQGVNRAAKCCRPVLGTLVDHFWLRIG